MPMKPGMKMMMMQRMAQDQNRNQSEYGGNRRMIGYDRENNGNAARSNYGNMEGGSMNYGGGSNYSENRMAYGMEEPESRRRRDSRGRFMEGEGWEGNQGYPRSEYDERKYGMARGSPDMGGHDPEARRRRDSRGRYALNLMDDDDEPEMRQQTWFPPMGNMYPMGMHPGNSYGDVYAHGTIYAPGAMNKPMGMQGEMNQPVDEHTARMWVQKMDGGEHFKVEQTEQQRMAVCPNCERWEFYTAMNAMYSDHCESAKKMGIDRPDYYAHLAKDFLKDKDAKPHKLRRYMEHIAK